jgi:hypothetical protein
LVGGLQNAIDRKESIAVAMQSFINAGYTPQEVELAAKKVNEVGGSSLSQQNNNSPSEGVVGPLVVASKKLPSQVPLVVEKKSKRVSGVIIGLLIALGLIVVSLILLYIFQEQVF